MKYDAYNMLNQNLNIVPESIPSMTKATIKVERELRQRIRVLAAKLDIEMGQTVEMAVECLENSLAGEEVK